VIAFPFAVNAIELPPTAPRDPARRICRDQFGAGGSQSAAPDAMTRAVPQTSTTQGKTSARKTKGQEKDFVTRLADAGEDALQRIAELPGGQRALGAFNDLRMRVDDLTKKVRGIDALEARVAKLEKQLAELKAPRRTTSRTTRKPSP
jgi:hypothetical protein